MFQIEASLRTWNRNGTMLCEEFANVTTRRRGDSGWLWNSAWETLIPQRIVPEINTRQLTTKPGTRCTRSTSRRRLAVRFLYYGFFSIGCILKTNFSPSFTNCTSRDQLREKLFYIDRKHRMNFLSIRVPANLEPFRKAVSFAIHYFPYLSLDKRSLGYERAILLYSRINVAVALLRSSQKYHKNTESVEKMMKIPTEISRAH